jgi:hypothetical protein
LLLTGHAWPHAAIPLYTEETPRQLAAVVRVEREHVDYERKGFFHIGLLPILALEDVTFEARAPGGPAASLACLRRWLGSPPGKRLELRRVKFLFGPGNSLEAALARCLAEDHWELRDGVRFLSGGQEVQATRGILLMTGPRAGQVILETVPRSTNSFPTFASAVLPSPDPSH